MAERTLIEMIMIRLGRAMNHEVAARMQERSAREMYKQAEDVVIAEIWETGNFKNDRERTAQKHLARINDVRLTSAQLTIDEAWSAIASAQFTIIQCQADLQKTLIDYEFELLGKRGTIQQTTIKLMQEIQPDTAARIVTTLDKIDSALASTPPAVETLSPDVSKRIATEAIENKPLISDDEINKRWQWEGQACTEEEYNRQIKNRGL